MRRHAYPAGDGRGGDGVGWGNHRPSANAAAKGIPGTTQCTSPTTRHVKATRPTETDLWPGGSCEIRRGTVRMAAA